MPPLQRVLWLLVAQGALGAFDTIYFHELRARLPALQSRARAELFLHSLRSIIYGIFFLTLPWLSWNGGWTAALAALLALEIFITMYDFVIEDWVRKPLGGVYPAERVLHGVLGVLYGIFLANLFPLLIEWWRRPTGLARHATGTGGALEWTMAIMGILATISGLRDLAAAFALPHSGWPWVEARSAKRSLILR
jgi:hypothetical protein